MSGTEVYRKACPDCKGHICWFWYDDDCRGNAGGSHIVCLSCNRVFTVEEGRAFTKDKKKAKWNFKKQQYV